MGISSFGRKAQSFDINVSDSWKTDCSDLFNKMFRTQEQVAKAKLKAPRKIVDVKVDEEPDEDVIGPLPPTPDATVAEIIPSGKSKVTKDDSDDEDNDSDSDEDYDLEENIHKRYKSVFTGN